MKTSIKLSLLFFAFLYTSCSIEPINENELLGTEPENSISTGTDGDSVTDNGEEKQSTEPGDSVNTEGSSGEGEIDNGEDRIQTDPKDSTNTGDTTPPPPPPPTEDRGQIDPEKDCPPNDRNCNGIPDDEERQVTEPGDDGTIDETDPDDDGEGKLHRFDTGHEEVGDPEDQDNEDEIGGRFATEPGDDGTIDEEDYRED